MKSIYTSVIIIFLVSSLPSCYTTTPKYLYAPNSANLLQTEKKGDLKAAINYAQSKHSGNNDEPGRQISNGIDVQTAYSLIDNLVFKAAVFGKWETDRSGINQINPYKFRLDYKRKGTDISIGYYKFLSKKKQISLTIDCGIGVGKTSFNGTYRKDTINKYFYSANHTALLITPSIVLKPSKNYSLIIAYRLSAVNFFNINTNDVALTKGLYAAFADKKSIYGDIIIENEFGFNKLQGFRFHWQLGISKLQTHFSYDQVNSATYGEDQYEYNNSFGSIGIVADIKKLIAKK